MQMGMIGLDGGSKKKRFKRFGRFLKFERYERFKWFNGFNEFNSLEVSSTLRSLYLRMFVVVLRNIHIALFASLRALRETKKDVQMVEDFGLPMLVLSPSIKGGRG